MTKQQRKMIEREFYNYEKNRNEAADYISSRALARMGVDYSRERVKSSNGNFVEESLINAVDEYERLYNWCLVYEKTLDRFRWTLKDKLMQMRYIDRNHVVCICDVIGISERAMRYWVEEILHVAFMWAQEYGLL